MIRNKETRKNWYDIDYNATTLGFENHTFVTKAASWWITCSVGFNVRSLQYLVHLNFACAAMTEAASRDSSAVKLGQEDLLLYTLGHDPSVKIRRAAAALLRLVQVCGNFHSLLKHQACLWAGCDLPSLPLWGSTQHQAYLPLLPAAPSISGCCSVSPQLLLKCSNAFCCPFDGIQVAEMGRTEG